MTLNGLWEHTKVSLETSFLTTWYKLLELVNPDSRLTSLIKRRRHLETLVRRLQVRTTVMSVILVVSTLVAYLLSKNFLPSLSLGLFFFYAVLWRPICLMLRLRRLERKIDDSVWDLWASMSGFSSEDIDTKSHL